MIARVLLGAAGGGAVVAFAILVARETPGPGPLAAVHAAVPELEGGRICTACHGTSSAPDAMTRACATCHAEIVDSIEWETGLHGALADAADCARCHRDHLGPDHELAGDAAFRFAGFVGLSDYAHEGLGFGLSGVHTDLDCAACHANAAKDDVAASRFLGLSQSCASCHDDAHGGELGPDCASCHGQSEPFPVAPHFDHTDAFPLEGVHAGLACATCHESVTFADALERHAVRACADCHASPHRAAFLDAAGGDCAACHVPLDMSFLGADAEVSRAAHPATGFALEAAHAAVDCTSCHPPGDDFDARHPGRIEQECASCHADPHGGQFDDPHARACAECHETTAFADSLFDAAAHAAAGWPLDGAHASLACALCHPDVTEPTVFRGTSTTCADCHDDPHAGAFAGRPGGGDCATCHAAESFASASHAFDHARWTSFPLTGAHARLDCAGCHVTGPGGVLAPARTSFLPGHVDGDPQSCVTCHADPHGGRFDRLEPTPDVGPAAHCARCHDETSFAPVPPDRFDHGAWTGFALDGAHAQAACAACHEPANGDTAPLAAIRGASCATCHDDPHGDAFRALVPDAASDCARCHDGSSFRATRGFDHAATGWSLLGAHVDAECADCHVAARRGRHLDVRGTSCAECHADPHGGQFGAPAADCARCHGESSGFAADRFDHGETRFPLDAVHAPLDCAACHRPGLTRDGRRLVRYRPLGTECRDCHGGSRRRREGAR